MAEEIIEGSPLHYNVGTQERYRLRVNRELINPLMNETEDKMNNLFEEFAAGLIAFPVLNSRARRLLKEIDKKYGIIFKRQAEKIAKDYVEDIQKQSKSGVKRNLKILSLGRATAYNENKANDEAIYKTSNDALLLLLLGMYRFYLDKVRDRVTQEVLAKSGSSPARAPKVPDPKGKVEVETPPDDKAPTDSSLEDYLKKQRGITHRKAKNDLNRKYRQIFNSLNTDRLKRNGLARWVWVHTNRAKEQNPYHVNSLNRLTFFIGAPPPVIDQATGTTGYPGDWYGCMCIMLPVRVFTDAS